MPINTYGWFYNPVIEH